MSYELMTPGEMLHLAPGEDLVSHGDIVYVMEVDGPDGQRTIVEEYRGVPEAKPSPDYWAFRKEGLDYAGNHPRIRAARISVTLIDEP